MTDIQFIKKVLARLAFVASLTLIITACAAFSYRYYGIEFAEKSENVILLGPSAKDDKSFLLCQNKGACVVLFEAEFFKLRRDYEEKSIRLAELERRCGKP